MTRVAASIPAGARVLVDTSVLIAHLGGVEPVAPAATELLEGCLRTGRNDGVISSITVAELLVRPFRTSVQAIDTAIAFLWSLPDLLIRSADFLIAAEAARVRAATGLGLLDASILATAVLTSSNVLVTNDRALAAATPSIVPELRVLLLADLVG
jgi:predicted nucleic acid-binding protein